MPYVIVLLLLCVKYFFYLQDNPHLQVYFIYRDHSKKLLTS